MNDPPNFQVLVANGQLEKPIATATIKFGIEDQIFAKHFVLIINMTKTIIRLHFMRHNSVVIDATHGLINFSHLTMQVKSAASETSAKPQVVFIHGTLKIPPMTTKTITASVDHPSEWNTTCTVATVKNFAETASRLETLNVYNI